MQLLGFCTILGHVLWHLAQLLSFHKDDMLPMSGATSSHSLAGTSVLLLQVPIRDTYPQRTWSKKVSGVGVTTATIMKTKKESLHHLGSYHPSGVSQLGEAEEESERTKRMRWLSRLWRKGAGG